MGITLQQAIAQGGKVVAPQQSAAASAYQSLGAPVTPLSTYAAQMGKPTPTTSPGANNSLNTGTDPRLANLPSTYTAENFAPAFMDTAVKPIATGAAELGVKGYDIAAAAKDLVQSGGKPSVQAGQDINAPRTLPYVGKVQPPDPNTISGFLKTALDAFNTAGAVDGVRTAPEALSKLSSLLNDAIDDVVTPKGTSAIHIPNGPNGENIYAKLTPQQQEFLTPEVKNIPFDAADKPHLTPLSTLEDSIKANANREAGIPAAKRVSLDEIKAASPNAKAALDKFDSLAKPTVAEPNGLAAVEAQRTAAAEQGVKAVSTMQDQVGGFKSKIGSDFQQGAANIEQAKPDARLNLSSKQLQDLNALKENKSFALPKYLEQTDANMLPESKFGSIKLTPEAKAEFEAGQNKPQAALSPTQAQDLITQLNKSTFKETGGGLQVDQQRIALTNEIKAAASKAFGPEWDKVYSNYSQGIGAIQKLNDIVNLDPRATPSDINASLQSVLKLGKTPEGKIILQNAIDEFKQTSGIDLTDPTKAIHQILDKQIALQEAQSAAGKPGFLKQAFDPKYLARRAIGGTVTVGLLYPVLRALQKTMSGK